MSDEGLRRAVSGVEDTDRQVTGFGDMGGVGRGLVAVAWGLVAVAEAVEKVAAKD